MEPPKFEALEAAVDAYVAKRYPVPRSEAAQVSAATCKTTVLLCRLEEAAKLLAQLLEDHAPPHRREWAADFLTKIATPEVAP